MAMIAAGTEFGGPGFLVPTRNYELLSWCLGNRLRLVYQMTLMTIGLYNEPAGVWLPWVTLTEGAVPNADRGSPSCMSHT